MKLHIAIIYGSVRHHRQGIRGAYFLQQKLKERGHQITFIDPKAYELPLLDKMYKEYDEGQAPDVLETLHQKLEAAEAFLLVSGEYNHSMPPAMKNLLDHFQQEYFYKPSATAVYSAGAFGGVRAAVHVREIAGELGMPSIPSVFPMPKVQDNFDEDGTPRDEKFNKYVKRFLDELEWYGEALKVQREKGT